MGLPYPGGPQIDRLAKEGKPHYKLPKIKTQNPLDFSFSGLKSSVLQLIQRNKEELIVADLAYAFQEAAINEIMNKTLIALEQNSIKHFVLAGGVAANSRLRERVLELNTYYPELKITIPPMWCCTDNAAMIGAVAYVAYQHGVAGDLSISANPGLDYA